MLQVQRVLNGAIARTGTQIAPDWVSITTAPGSATASATVTTTITYGVSRFGRIDTAAAVAWTVTSDLDASKFQSGQAFSGTLSWAVDENGQRTVDVVLTAQATTGGFANVTFTLSSPQGVIILGPFSATTQVTLPSAAAMDAVDDTARVRKRTASQDSSVEIDVVANDTNASGASLSATDPAHGTTTVQNGKVLYRPDQDYVGADSFDYTITRGSDSSTGTVSVTVYNPSSQPLGPTPFSNYSGGWWTGCWINGSESNGNSKALWLQNFRGGLGIDCGTQSLKGMAYWYQHGGCDTQAQLDAQHTQDRSAFSPNYRGVFANQSWKANVWGTSRATYHRARLLHLCWMTMIPSSVGNGWNKDANPQRWNNTRCWYDIAVNGTGDKAFYNLGRCFAKLDMTENDDVAPYMVFDVGYEWTQDGKADFPGGYYTDPNNNQTKAHWLMYPIGWSRLIKVFKTGYQYQRQIACPYRFCWRPQQKFNLHTGVNQRGNNSNGDPVSFSVTFPGNARNHNIASDVVIGNKTVLYAGNLGLQVDYVGLSMHDNTGVWLRGSSASATGNNWATQRVGGSNWWGPDTMANLARSNNILMCMPEWGARREDEPENTAPNPYSPYPGDYYRFMYDFMDRNRDVCAYETVFQHDTGKLTSAWVPDMPDDQDPRLVYPDIWSP